MVVEMICVGTELLRGSVVNTNAAYMAEMCAKLGYEVKHQSVVGDEEDAIEEAMRQAGGRAQVVILTGGLGPTKDDVTKEVAAKVIGKGLVEDELAKKNIEERFRERGVKKVPRSNYKQALVIKGSTVLYNQNGTAPGLIVDTKADKHYVLLPGPPNELKPMFEEWVVSYLRKIQQETWVTKTVKLCGVGESAVEQEIRERFQDKAEATIATYAKTGEVHLHVTAKGENKRAANKLVNHIVKELCECFGDRVYSLDDKETLEECVIKLLKHKELTLTTAESCTGGLLAGRLVNVPGASRVLLQGLVTYSNKAKRKYLGVSKETLKQYGAVSKRTAKEMAKYTAIKCGCDMAVAITGVAGPDGGSEEKPVGTTFLSCYYNGKTAIKECHFLGDRQKVREEAVAAALCLLRDCVITKP